MDTITLSKNRLKTSIKDIELSSTGTTRVILRSEIFDGYGLRLRLIHQKGSNKWEHIKWEDENNFDKRTLKQGEFVDFELGTKQTKKLLEALPNLAALAEIDLDYGATECMILKGKEREIIDKLINEAGEIFWDLIEELNPGLISKISILKEHEKRKELLRRFERHLREKDWTETKWQTFFDQNKWIFGHGLDYQILKAIQDQPYIGGQRVDGKGAQRGDNLMATAGHSSFTVLVEIKKPQSPLLRSLKKNEYRNNAYVVGNDLAGGISQLQVNCDTWNIEGAGSKGNRNLEKQRIYTCQPKGILIIGHLEQLDTDEKLHCFQLFRRNLQNPEILTFDELYERAKFITTHLHEGL